MLIILICLSLAAGAVQAEPSKFDTEKIAGMNEPAVPRDRLLEPKFVFSAPSYEDVVRSFEVAHAYSEVTYKGNGYWDSAGEYPSNVRNTSNRVLGYLAGYRALGREIYKQRAVEGLEYLLRVQSKDGDFPWYNSSYRGIYNRDDGLYETGIAGRAFIEGYKLTRDKRYLDASRRVARWEIDCPISKNNNYNMFAVWHLVEHYRITRDAASLKAAIDKTRLGGLPGQMHSGGWPEHNSWLWYHGIIVRGMADLYNVLPDDHPFKPELKAALIAAINRALRDQVASGEVPLNTGVIRKSHTCAFMLQALLIAREAFGSQLDNCIHGIMGYRVNNQIDDAYIRAYDKAWNEYDSARDAALKTATGTMVWRADLSRFINDPTWGEMASGAFNCWYPVNDFQPGKQVWRKAASERTGLGAQEIVSKGVKLFGGMGWTVPEGLLTPGRAYRFTAFVKCTGTPENMPIVLASAYTGEKRPVWDPASGCKATRENPSFDSFTKVSVVFTAVEGMNNVYIWSMGKDITDEESVSLIVDEAFITDTGNPLPQWQYGPQAYDQPDMSLLPTGIYLEAIFPGVSCID